MRESARQKKMPTGEVGKKEEERGVLRRRWVNYTRFDVLVLRRSITILVSDRHE